eukprot:18683-Eustigmatos_ZCMA.PRE.1
MLNTWSTSLLTPVGVDRLLIEVDADELWTAAQLRHLISMFTHNASHSCAYFDCHFHVGHAL